MKSNHLTARAHKRGGGEKEGRNEEEKTNR